MTVKQSYTVPCGTTFRDAVAALAERRRVNVGDLARSVMLMVPESEVSSYVDPGEPDKGDREQIVLKSGPSQGRPWRRKPRLQVRMVPGLKVPFIRRALNLALAMDRGELVLRLEDPKRPVTAKSPPTPPPSTAQVPAEDIAAPLRDEVERLRAMVAVLAFEPLDGGVGTRAEALHVMGFPPNTHPDPRTVRARFRMLATIHHPDGPHGSHARMSQLNQAMEVLRRN